MAWILGCKNLKYLPLDITAKTLNGIYERESCITTTVTLYAKKLFSNGKESLILMDFCWWRDRLNKRNVLKCESFARKVIWLVTDMDNEDKQKKLTTIIQQPNVELKLDKIQTFILTLFSFDCIFQWNHIFLREI